MKIGFGSFKILPVTQITQRQRIGGLMTNEMKRMGVVEVACFKELSLQSARGTEENYELHIGL
jgi:hypothetical protein